MEVVEVDERDSSWESVVWSAALVVDDSQHGRGLIWLSGGDDNSSPQTARERRMRAEMQDRYLSSRSRKKLPLTLPDGRRVIRLFPDWGREWPLWESFSDDYTLSADDLTLSPGLANELYQWNQTWQRRSETDPIPDGWMERGRELHADMQEELKDLAEVRADFDRE
jgi:hypothetical protein